MLTFSACSSGPSSDDQKPTTEDDSDTGIAPVDRTPPLHGTLPTLVESRDVVLLRLARERSRLKFLPASPDNYQNVPANESQERWSMKR